MSMKTSHKPGVFLRILAFLAQIAMYAGFYPHFSLGDKTFENKPAGRTLA